MVYKLHLVRLPNQHLNLLIETRFAQFVAGHRSRQAYAHHKYAYIHILEPYRRNHGDKQNHQPR